MSKEKAEEKAREYFLTEIRKGKIFISMPDKYKITIDNDDNVFVNAEWEDGTKDYTGLGNIYKIIYTDLSTENAQLREALREIIKECEEWVIPGAENSNNCENNHYVEIDDLKDFIVQAKQLLTDNTQDNEKDNT